MLYTSTRDASLRITSAEAITRGISADGGLFVPCETPKIDGAFLQSLVGMTYLDRAKTILKLFLTDLTPEEIDECVDAAYAPGKFSSEDVAPVVGLHDNVHVLELWHGPTCAFKDMALQLLPHLLKRASARTLQDKRIVILVATSGDTGKAALEGFRDVEGTNIVVFYPNSGVSPMQQKQMRTQEGANVGVCAVNGNFDDAQTGVKAIFTDPGVKRLFDEKGFVFSSANSINWGRLVPQIVYYFSAYADLVKQGRIVPGEKINFVVPTGNFGNILAANYAVDMGLPVKRLICASNANNVLTDFIETGVYDRNRRFFMTISPSMDILISSNLERLVFALSGGDDARVRALYGELKETGRFDLGQTAAERVRALYAAGCCDDAATKRTIRETFEKHGYLCDTHTAVAVRVYEDYRARTGDVTPTVIDSTASPFKFCTSVVEALGETVDGDDFAMLEKLERITGVQAPAQLAGLRDKTDRFDGVCERSVDAMRGVIERSLGI